VAALVSRFGDYGFSIRRRIERVTWEPSSNEKRNANNSEHAEPKKEDRALEKPVQNIVTGKWHASFQFPLKLVNLAIRICLEAFHQTARDRPL
jgi:hypothetical protein